MNKFLKRIGTTGFLVMVLMGSLTAVLFADIETPAYLDSSTQNIPGGNHSYELFYTIDCNGGEDCECDDIADLDTDGDDVPDTDSANDCVATFDSDFDNVPDSFFDADFDGVPDVADLDWAGGGMGSGIVESVPRNIQNSVNRYVFDWGMKDPKWDLEENRDIYMFAMENYLGFANLTGENYHAPEMLQAASEPRATVLHELWHNVQFNYDAGGGTWYTEGQARMMQDKVFEDSDHLVGSQYHGSVNVLQGNPTYVKVEDRNDDGTSEFNQAMGLLGAKYDAALFWTYAIEQGGSDFVGTAGEGVDLMIEVLEQADENGRKGVDGTGAALQEAIGQSFEDTYWDFVIANYANHLDLSELDHSYLGGRDPEVVLTYRDENPTAPDILLYDPVARTNFSTGDMLTGILGAVAGFDSEVSDANALPAYGAQYYEADIPFSGCELFYWRVLGEANAVLLNTFMAIEPDSDGDSVDEITILSRSKGQNFARAAWNFDPFSGQYGIYDRMATIVAAGNEPYGYQYEAGCTTVDIDLQYPTTSNPEFVGVPTEPGRFLVWVELSGSAGTANFIEGLEWARDFTVMVGSDEATILNGGYVGNEYWLEVQAPDKPGAGIGDAFDLEVFLGPIALAKSDSETDAIVYDVLLTDQVLVIDRSGSMGDNNKLESAQTAARLYADVTQQFERLGVASFAKNASTDFWLTFVPDQDDGAGVRGTAQAAIDGITSGGPTSIGDGLQAGQTMLNFSGDPTRPWAMILLSDGMENEPQYWNDVKANIEAIGTEVHAIALGQDADEEQMRDIAQTTCGPNWQEKCYHYIDESGVAFNMSGRSMNSGSLSNALADLYLQIKENIAGQQRLWQDGGTVDGIWNIPIAITEDGLQDAFLSVHWDDAANPLDVNLSGPGTFETLTDGQTHVVFSAEHLPAGNYVLTLESTSGPSDWIGSLSGTVIQGTSMNVFIASPEDERFPGLRLPLQVALTDNDGGIAGAEVTAVVRHPDGDTQTIQFADDGGIYDDVAGDGVYGYVYDRVNRPLDFDVLSGHTWVFDVEATGFNNDGVEFTRYEQIAYTPNMEIDPAIMDGDGDLMIDLWEDRFAATNRMVADGHLDPDRDGLTNKEEFELGTNPDNPDTDYGGELDGSEAAKGQNPLWPTDDTIPVVTDFWIENQPGSVILHFDPRPEYLRMRVYRRKGLAGSFNLVGELAPGNGQITDAGLTNDQDYFYFIQPLGAFGATGRATIVRYGEPALDPYAPEGSVLINGGEQVTNKTAVELNIEGSIMRDLGIPEVVMMQVSNTPNFDTAVWQPYTMNLDWVLEPDPVTGVAFVYVRFLDRAGNASDFVQGDGIIYEPLILVPSNGILDLVWALFNFDHIPMGSFSLNYTKLSSPDLGYTTVQSGQYSGENSRMDYRLQAGKSVQLYYGGRNFMIEATDKNGNAVSELPRIYEMTIHYEDWQWQSGGILSESSLMIYHLTERGWMPLSPCDGCSHDMENNVIVVQTTAVGEFALLGNREAQTHVPFVDR